jgi:hypothetical protein
MHCTINAGIAGVKPDGGFARLFCRLNHGNHFFQRHAGAVVNFTFRAAVFLQQAGIDQASGINHHIRLSQKLCAPDGNQVNGT